jgi:imidazolonepropionase-like amidohydrolase
MRLFRYSFISWALTAALPAAAQTFGPPEPPFVPGAPIAIVGGMLIDGTGAPARLDQAVLIEGDRIRWVGPSEDLRKPEGAHVIDASDMTILPGLINSNQHIQLNPLYPAPEGGLSRKELEERWESTFRRMPDRAFHYLMQGVTSMRQTSGPAKRLLPVKQAIDRGEIPGPRIYLGGALLMSPESWQNYLERQKTPPESVSFLRDEFAFTVIDDVDRDTDQFLGEEFPYWKLLMSGERYDGKNDFTDDQIRFIIDKAHRHGKKIDVHCGGHNDGLRRILAFDIDTLEHPFYGGELIEEEIIRGYVDKGAIVATLLTVMVSNAERAADPHRFSETLYAMTMDPKEYRILMRYRDKMLANQRSPDDPGIPVYESASGGEEELGSNGPSYNTLQKRRLTSRENMRRFIRAGAKFSMGTDTPAFLNFIQEDPNAGEIQAMVELGMSPLQAIEAATRIGAEALGLEKDLGTIEAGKLADVIVLAGNPLADIGAFERVYGVIKGGVRYK